MSISYDLSGKTAIVTGGANGIGRAIATRLAASSVRVCIWDIEHVDIQGISSIEVDLTQPEQIVSAVKRSLTPDSSIDILVNDAGCLGSYLPFEELPASEWNRILSVNLLSVLQVSRQLLPYLRRSSGGRIVNMGSLAGKEGLPCLSVYSAASAGVIAFTKALAKELAGTGIRANCVAPGPIATDLILRLGPAVVDEMISRSPLRRLGTVEEVAELVLWLCSEASSFNSGAVFDMSGGRAAY